MRLHEILKESLQGTFVPDTLNENQLSILASADQAERNEYSRFVKTHANGDWKKGAQKYAAEKNRPADDIFGERHRLQIFIKTTFDFAIFNNNDWDNYFLLAQHCDFDREFQQHALSIITKHDKNKSHVEYLSDRISCGLTGTQKYGTQDICGIDV